MLGWEDPDRIHGGLGVASAALADALGEVTDLSYWFPSSLPASGQGSYQEKRFPVALPAYAHGEDAYGPELRRAWELYTQAVIKEGLRTHPELIHAHDWMTFPAAGILAKALDIPLVYHVHSIAPDREETPGGLAWETEQQWLPKADMVLTVSDYTAAQLISRFDIEPDRVHVLRHGKPEIVPYRTQKPFSEKLVVFIGRMTWQKGPHHFLNMALRLHAERPDLRFVMAGEGDQWASVLQTIARHRAGLRIQAPGRMTRDQIFDLLSMADLLVMTSESEPLGLVAVEAAHFDVPMILPPHCGAAELFPDAPVLAPHDTDHLCETLVSLIDNPKKRKAQVKQNQARIEQMTWESSASELLTSYAHLFMTGS